MNRQEAVQVVVAALKILGSPNAKPQLPNRRLSAPEVTAFMPRHSELHKRVVIAIYQPERIKRFRDAMEVYEAIEDSRMRIQ